MSAKTRAPRGGKGSNQYQTKSRSDDPADRTEAIRGAVELEAAAWAFDSNRDNPVRDEDAFGRLTAAACVRFAGHPSYHHRESAAGSRNCPPELLAVLADDSHVRVRSAVIRNPSCPPDLILKLVEPSYPHHDEYEAAALNNPNCPAEAFPLILRFAKNEPTRRNMYARAAGHRNCPPDILVEHAKGDASSRATVAKNPACPPELLAELYESEAPVPQPWMALKALVLANPSCPVAVMEDAVRTLGGTHLWVLGRNPALPPHLWRPVSLRSVGTYEPPVIARWAASDDPTAAEFVVLAERGNKQVRFRVAENPNTPAEVLDRLTYNPTSVKQMRLVAVHPNTPTDTLQRLAQHGNRRLSFWAREALAARIRSEHTPSSPPD